LFSKGNVRRAVGNGVIEILDRAALAKGQALTLVRVGDRVVLLGQSAQGFTRLAEFAADSSEAVNTIAEHASRDHAANETRRRVG
jgi:flagellar biogenesis protein FliO